MSTAADMDTYDAVALLALLVAGAAVGFTLTGGAAGGAAVGAAAAMAVMAVHDRRRREG